MRASLHVLAYRGARLSPGRWAAPGHNCVFWCWRTERGERGSPTAFSSRTAAPCRAETRNTVNYTLTATSWRTRIPRHVAQGAARRGSPRDQFAVCLGGRSRGGFACRVGEAWRSRKFWSGGYMRTQYPAGLPLREYEGFLGYSMMLVVCPCRPCSGTRGTASRNGGTVAIGRALQCIPLRGRAARSQTAPPRRQRHARASRDREWVGPGFSSSCGPAPPL